MERDALLSHGASFLLHDRLMNSSDRHLAYVCRSCGSFIGPSFSRDSVISAAQAGPVTVLTALASSHVKVACRGCTERASSVALPYVFRYLAYELAAMNIKVSMGVQDV
jgi:DNA-directed RNA polymerase I subunit RPA2